MDRHPQHPVCATGQQPDERTAHEEPLMNGAGERTSDSLRFPQAVDYSVWNTGRVHQDTLDRHQCKINAFLRLKPHAGKKRTEPHLQGRRRNAAGRPGDPRQDG